MKDPINIADIHAVAADPDAISWVPLRPGIEIHRIYQGGPDGPAAAFLRYQPGAKLARHRHTGLEHIIVLRGSQEDERGHYRTGAMVVNPTGTAHDVSSKEGCIVLALWERPVSFDIG